MLAWSRSHCSLNRTRSRNLPSTSACLAITPPPSPPPSPQPQPRRLLRVCRMARRRAVVAVALAQVAHPRLCGTQLLQTTRGALAARTPVVMVVVVVVGVVVWVAVSMAVPRPASREPDCRLVGGRGRRRCRYSLVGSWGSCSTGTSYMASSPRFVSTNTKSCVLPFVCCVLSLL